MSTTATRDATEGDTPEGDRPTGDDAVNADQHLASRLAPASGPGVGADANAGADASGVDASGVDAAAAAGPSADHVDESAGSLRAGESTIVVADAESDTEAAEDQAAAEVRHDSPVGVEPAGPTTEQTVTDVDRSGPDQPSPPTTTADGDTEAATAEAVDTEVVGPSGDSGRASAPEDASSSETEAALDGTTDRSVSSGRPSADSSPTAVEAAVGQRTAIAAPEAVAGPVSGPATDRSGTAHSAVDPSAGSRPEIVSVADSPSAGHVLATPDGAPDQGLDRTTADAASRAVNLPGDVSVERSERPAVSGSVTSPSAPELSDGATEELWGQVQRALHRARVGPTGSELRLRLRPAELGDLLVQVRTVGDQLAVRLVTSSLSAQQVLVNDQSRLAAELAAAGFDDGSFDISHQGESNDGSGSSTGHRPDSEQQPSALPTASASSAVAERLDRSIATTDMVGRRSSVELKL